MPTTVTITYLEMLAPDALRPKACPDPRFTVRETTVKQWEFNRFLYLFVGRDWYWNEKKTWHELQWKEYVESPRLRTFAAFYDGSVAGYFELKTDPSGGVEIAIFGLTPAFVGRGFGGVMLTIAIQEAWKMRARRVWLHTCTLDHPAAIHNYLARGMLIYKTESRLI